MARRAWKRLARDRLDGRIAAPAHGDDRRQPARSRVLAQSSVEHVSRRRHERATFTRPFRAHALSTGALACSIPTSGGAQPPVTRTISPLMLPLASEPRNTIVFAT